MGSLGEAKRWKNKTCKCMYIYLSRMIVNVRFSYSTSILDEGGEDVSIDEGFSIPKPSYLPQNITCPVIKNLGEILI